EDAVNRRRAWAWRWLYSLVAYAGIAVFVITTAFFLVRLAKGESPTFVGTAGDVVHGLGHALSSPQLWQYALILIPLFLVNFVILIGPMMAMGIMQIQACEPGTADWGVRLEDVRGQAEAKEEVRRVVSLWQSGEAFERAGGKR